MKSTTATPTAVSAYGDHSTRDNTSGTPVIERALSLLTDAGFDFEIVDRCPEPCAQCDGSLATAA